MKELPLQERPYERCISEGPRVLSDAQLLAIVLRTGSKTESSLELASRVLTLGGPGGGLVSLLHVSFEELTAIQGIGKVKAVQLLCIGELSRRIWKQRTLSRTDTFNEPAQVADYYREDLRHLEREEFRVMMFNTRQVLIGESLLSVGTVNAAIATPREIFIEALRRQAVSLIIVHNHPSGDPAPSEEDILLTERIRRAGSLIGIQLLDHIIVGDRTYVSLKERGYFDQTKTG